MDELEFDDDRTRMVLSCMDLGEVPEADRPAVGLRVAAKLEAVLQHLNIDLLSVPDAWEVEPLIFGKETEWQVTLARQADGAWRFDRETIARVPEMFDRLPPEEKARNDRSSLFGSARQTMRTFRKASPAATTRWPPRPSTSATSPSVRGIASGRSWRTSSSSSSTGSASSTCRRFPTRAKARGTSTIAARWAGSAWSPPRRARGKGTGSSPRDRRPDRADVPGAAPTGIARSGASVEADHTRRPAAPASRPSALRGSQNILGLTLYQWMAGWRILLAAGLASWLTFRILDSSSCAAFVAWRFNLSSEFLCAKLRPLACQLFVLIAGTLLPLLDLPASLVSAGFPIAKIVWIGLMAWTVIRLIDLGMALYTNSEHLQPGATSAT